RASGRRASALGGRASRLAPLAGLRRGAPPHRAPPARAPLLLRCWRAALVGAAPRRPVVVHVGVEAPVRARDVARATCSLAGVPLVGPPVLPLPGLRPARRRRRHADRGILRDARRDRLAPAAHPPRERGAAAGTRARSGAEDADDVALALEVVDCELRVVHRLRLAQLRELAREVAGLTGRELATDGLEHR